MTVHLTAVRDMLRAADPGLRRLRTAAQATVTWAVVVAALGSVVTLTGASLAYVFPGMLVVSAATMSLSMNLTASQRTRALLISAASASAAITLATAVSGSPVVESVTFLALGLVTLGAFLLGPGAIVIALTAIVAYYAGSLVDPTWPTLAGNVASAVAGALCCAVLLGMVFRDRPAPTARRLLDSVNAAIRRVNSRTARNRPRRVGALLNAITTAQSHINLYPEVWPAALRGGDTVLAAAARAAEGAAIVAPIGPQRWPVHVRVKTRNTIDAHDPGGRGVVSMGIQLLVATTLALVAAQLISGQYWFWGVLAAVVMLFGTTSASDAVGKGLSRVIGTAIALPVGVAVAALVQHEPLLAAALVLVTMFLQQYFADVAYGASVFFLTVLLSLLLAATGADTDASLEIRLLLTAVGGGIGILVSLLVLPTRTGPLLRDRAVAAFSTAEKAIIAVRDQESIDVAQAHAGAAVRRLKILHHEAAAAQKGWPFSSRHERVRRQLAAGDDAARALADLITCYARTSTVTSSAYAEAAALLTALATARRQLSGTTTEEPDTLKRAGSSADPLTLELRNVKASLHALLTQLAK